MVCGFSAGSTNENVKLKNDKNLFIRSVLYFDFVPFCLYIDNEMQRTDFLHTDVLSEVVPHKIKAYKRTRQWYA